MQCGTCVDVCLKDVIRYASLMDMMKGLGKTLPGLENFYMVGQWTGMIGLSTAAISARKLVETLCRRGKRPFVTTVASPGSSRPVPDPSS